MNAAWGCAVAALFWLPNEGPTIRHFAPDYSTGVVEFDLFNAASQPLAAWSVVLIQYDKDGVVTAQTSESQSRIGNPEEYMAPGASQPFRRDMGNVENGARPSRVAVKVNAYVLADLTAHGDDAVIRRWVQDHARLVRDTQRRIEELDRKIAAGDPDAADLKLMREALVGHLADVKKRAIRRVPETAP